MWGWGAAGLLTGALVLTHLAYTKMALPTLWNWMRAAATKWPERLDALLLVFERAFVLLLGCVIAYCGWHLCFGDQKWAAGILATLSDHWKGALVLLVPAFYRTVRMWIEKARSFGPVSQPDDAMTDSNPPSA